MESRDCVFGGTWGGACVTRTGGSGGMRSGTNKKTALTFGLLGRGGHQRASPVEGTPHNQAPVSAVSWRLIQLVSIPVAAPRGRKPRVHILSCLKHMHVAVTQFNTGTAEGWGRGGEDGWGWGGLLLHLQTQITRINREENSSSGC